EQNGIPIGVTAKFIAVKNLLMAGTRLNESVQGRLPEAMIALMNAVKISDQSIVEEFVDRLPSLRSDGESESVISEFRERGVRFLETKLTLAARDRKEFRLWYAQLREEEKRRLFEEFLTSK